MWSVSSDGGPRETDDILREGRGTKEDLLLWEDFVNKFDTVDVQYSVPGCADKQKVCVWAFERAHGGSYLWWNLPDLYSNLGLAGQPAVWYQKHWPAWGRYLARNFDLEIPHLRRAKGTAQSKPENEPGSDGCGLPLGRERLLPKTSWSTITLVLFAAKFASNTQGRARDQVSTAWNACLRGLLMSWLCARERLRLPLYMDPVFVRELGSGVGGQHRVDVVVEPDGTVSLPQALSDIKGLGHDVFPSMEANRVVGGRAGKAMGEVGLATEWVFVYESKRRRRRTASAVTSARPSRT